MDKSRVITLNSDRNLRYNYVNVGNYLMSFNYNDNKVLLEYFDFNKGRKYTIYDGDGTDDFWGKESGFDKLDYLKSTIDHSKLDKFEFKVFVL